MSKFIEAMYSPQGQIINQTIAVVLMVIFVAALVINVGYATMVIVATSATVGFFCWRATNLRQPITPRKTAMIFLLTTAALHTHMIEEHHSLFGPAMSRLFDISFPDERFLLVFVFVLPIIYYLTAVGLLMRVPLAGFVAWFIFIGPGLAEVSHFILPFFTPALEPTNIAPISATIKGIQISGMENHYYPITGKYYFPGMYTAILPMIPGIYSILWLFKNRRAGVSRSETEMPGSVLVPLEASH